MQRRLLDLNKKCPKEGHQEQDILMVCLNSKCHQNLLCCCSCVDDDHVSHEIVSLRKFQLLLEQKLQTNNKNIQKIKISKLFEQYRIKFMENLKILENTLLSQVHSLEQQINQLFSDVHHSLTIPPHTQIVQNLLQSTDIKNWVNLFRQMQICSKYKIGTAINSSLILEHEFQIFQTKIAQTIDEVNSKFDILKNQIEILNFNSQLNQEPLVFHHAFRYFDMSRLDNQAWIEKKKNNGTRTAALGNRPLDPINNTVRFNIIRNGQGIPSICVGAAILSVVKKNNFANCTGHRRGVYCIDQASTSNWGSIQPSAQATSWNHDIQLNNSTIGFQFTEGDIIEMTIDFQNNTIIFELGQEMYSMEIDCTHRDIYPFVSLTNSNSIVQILQ